MYRVSHIIGPTLFFVISQVLEHLQRNFLPFFNSPGNLLHYSHKNFENWFRNSWDNWGQSWHPSFWNWYFAFTQSQKNNFGVTGATFDLNYLSYFEINFKNSCAYHVANFQGCWIKIRSSCVCAPEPEKMTKTKWELTYGTPCILHFNS